jgi:5-methylcytosine-specific restriction protein A
MNRLASAPAATVERKRGSAGVRDRNRIRERDCGLCQACKARDKATLGAAVDHKVPLWAGGSDDESNKWLLCTPCHDAKTAEEAKQRASGGYIA